MSLITLRDGTQVADPRLTRIVQFDPRSLNFPISAAIADGATPRSYTWQCKAHLDQGKDGACAGFTGAHELIARPKVVTATATGVPIDAKFAKERIYWEAQKIDQWAGGSYPGASPFYEGTSVLAVIKVLHKLGYIGEYRWCVGSSKTTALEDLVLAIGHLGPALLGVPWYEGMLEPWPCKHIHVTGQVVGGHAILCKGVNVRQRLFTLHNSWGAAWGNGGDCFISWKEMDRLLHEQGEACIPLSRSMG